MKHSLFTSLLIAVFVGIFGFQVVAFSQHEADHWAHHQETKNKVSFQEASCPMCVAHHAPAKVSPIVLSVDPELLPRLVRVREYFSQLSGSFVFPTQPRAPPVSLA